MNLIFKSWNFCFIVRFLTIPVSFLNDTDNLLKRLDNNLMVLSVLDLNGLVPVSVINLSKDSIIFSQSSLQLVLLCFGLFDILPSESSLSSSPSVTVSSDESDSSFSLFLFAPDDFNVSGSLDIDFADGFGVTVEEEPFDPTDVKLVNNAVDELIDELIVGFVDIGAELIDSLTGFINDALTGKLTVNATVELVDNPTDNDVNNNRDDELLIDTVGNTVELLVDDNDNTDELLVDGVDELLIGNVGNVGNTVELLVDDNDNTDDLLVDDDDDVNDVDDLLVDDDDDVNDVDDLLVDDDDVNDADDLLVDDDDDVNDADDLLVDDDDDDVNDVGDLLVDIDESGVIVNNEDVDEHINDDNLFKSSRNVKTFDSEVRELVIFSRSILL